MVFDFDFIGFLGPAIGGPQTLNVFFFSAFFYADCPFVVLCCGVRGFAKLIKLFDCYCLFSHAGRKSS